MITFSNKYKDTTGSKQTLLLCSSIMPDFEKKTLEKRKKRKTTKIIILYDCSFSCYKTKALKETILLSLHLLTSQLQRNEPLPGCRGNKPVSLVSDIPTQDWWRNKRLACMLDAMMEKSGTTHRHLA